MGDEDKDPDVVELDINKKHALAFLLIGIMFGNLLLAGITKFFPSMSFLTDIAVSQVCNEQMAHLTTEFSKSISELNVKVAVLETKLCMLEEREDC